MSLTAVLLAGGESRRMGQDKALLPWRGQPLWQWQLEKLRALRPERLLISARFRPEWQPADIQLVTDCAPRLGPLSGLAAALDTLKTDHLLALAVDMPEMTTEHLSGLCSLSSEEMGIVPMIGARAEPLCAIYPAAARPIFAAALQGNDFSLQPLVRKLIALNMVRVKEISGPYVELYQNMNEPGHLKEKDDPAV